MLDKLIEKLKNGERFSLNNDLFTKDDSAALSIMLATRVTESPFLRLRVIDGSLSRKDFDCIFEEMAERLLWFTGALCESDTDSLLTFLIKYS